MRVTGLGFIRLCGFAVLLGVAGFVVPATAQVATNSMTPEGATSFLSDYESGSDGDPAVTNAMKTLPDAVGKWRECYALCMKAPTECTARDCDGQCKGLVIAEGYAASQTAGLLNYNVMGIMGADCIGRFGEYIDDIQREAKRAHSLGLGLATIIAQAIVDQIMDATIGAILNSLTNQICNVTDQVLRSADSFVRNAICLPNINIKPFDFNLNLKELSCNGGFSINPLTGQVNGSPITGINVPITNIYNSGAVSNPSTIGTTSKAGVYTPTFNSNVNTPATAPDPVTLPTTTPAPATVPPT